MNRLVQAILYAVFAVGIGYFSLSPAYQYADAEMVSIKLSLSHAAERVEECVKLTPNEINQRALAGEPISECGRERLPLTIELAIDGIVVFHDVPQPSGLWGDGPASVYERFDVTAGRHTVAVRMRDTARSEGWDYAHEETVDLAPGRYFTVTFRAGTGGFNFR